MPASHAHSRLIDLDLTVEGVQHGYLEILRMQALAQSATLIPLSTIATGNADGPSVLFLGLHGATSARVLTRCLRTLCSEPVHGRVTVVPSLQSAASTALTALTPLIDAADVVVCLDDDFGNSIQAATAYIRLLPDRPRQREAESLMFAFGAAHSLRLLPPVGSDPLAELVEARGKLFVGCCPGNTAIGQAHAVHEAVVGCMNLLVQAGALERELELRASRILQLEPPVGSVFARHSGLLDLYRDPGQNVYRGSVLARLHPDGGAPASAIDILSPRDGVLLSVAAAGWVEMGDCVGVVADEMPH